ncbi:hypothetical protein UlMin_021276 [Ulmus minor]
MGPELDLKPKLESSVKSSLHKDGGSVDSAPDDQLMPSVKEEAPETEGLLVKQTNAANGSENEELNIVDITNAGDVELVEIEGLDEVEGSSSFGRTISDTEDGSMVDVDEVESQLCGDLNMESLNGGYNDPFRTRKKKLTPHWRKFIHPLMWRCKWVELQIKELQSLTQKYDRELAEYNSRKQFEFELPTSEGFNAKSLPFSSQTKRNKVMKRKKRKRIEEQIDVASYMSQHNLFSYYESKISVPGVASVEDDYGNRGKPNYSIDEVGTSDGLSCLEFQDGDSSLEEILWKIETVHSKVLQLKSRINKVVAENPCNAFVNSAQNSTPPEDGNRIQAESQCNASQDTSDHNMADLLIPDSATTSHREVSPDPEMIETTDQPQVWGLLGNTENGLLVYSKRQKKEVHDLENVRAQLIEKSQASTEEQNANPSEDDSTPKSRARNDAKSVPSSSKSHLPWKTRNRGKRKVGSRR